MSNRANLSSLPGPSRLYAVGGSALPQAKSSSSAKKQTPRVGIPTGSGARSFMDQVSEKLESGHPGSYSFMDQVAVKLEEEAGHRSDTTLPRAGPGITRTRALGPRRSIPRLADDLATFEVPSAASSPAVRAAAAKFRAGSATESRMAVSRSTSALRDNQTMRARPHTVARSEGNSNQIPRSGTFENKMDQMGDDPNVLKMELRRMQKQLVEMVRGKDRGVGGSQFRTNVQYQNRPRTAAGECTSCDSAKMAMRKVKAKLQEAVDHKAYLEAAFSKERGDHLQTREELDRVRQELLDTQALFAGRMSQMNSALRSKEDALATNTSSKATLTQNEAEINRLKARANSMEERNGKLQAEINKLRGDLTAQKTETQRVEMEWAITKDELELAKTKLQQMDGHLEEISALNKQLKEQGIELEKTHQARDLLEHELNMLKASIEKAKDRSARDSKSLQAEIAALKLKITEIEKERDDKEAQNQVLTEKNEKVTKELTEEEILHQEARDENAELFSKVQDLELDVKLLQQQYDASEEKLTALKTKSEQERAKLESRIKELEEKLSALTAKLHKQSRLHKQALEAALNSVVRLCVVAPTVNVNLSGNDIQMKAPLPNEKIKSFVEGEVLPKFARIFMQQDTNSNELQGPEGSNMDKWLQTLLLEMQTSIENYLSKLFKSQEQRR